MDTRITDRTVQEREAIDRALRKINTCMPGVIESFDEVTQTVSVVPAVKQRTFVDEKQDHLDPPTIVKAPLVFPFGSTAGFAMTFPVSKGDPCLIMFSQRGIDNWHERGGVQPPEEGVSGRHHSLTDAFVILSPSPLTQVLGGWQMDGIELRNRARTSYIKVRDEDIEAHSNTIDWTMDSEGKFTLTAPGGMSVDTPSAEYSGDVTADSISLKYHTHKGTVPPNV